MNHLVNKISENVRNQCHVHMYTCNCKHNHVIPLNDVLYPVEKLKGHKYEYEPYVILCMAVISYSMYICHFCIT